MEGNLCIAIPQKAFGLKTVCDAGLTQTITSELTNLRQALAELSVEGVPLLDYLLHLRLQLGRLLLLVLQALHLANNTGSSREFLPASKCNQISDNMKQFSSNSVCFASQLVSLVEHGDHQLLEVGLVLAVARGRRGRRRRRRGGELGGGPLRHAVLRDGRHHVAHHVPHDDGPASTATADAVSQSF